MEGLQNFLVWILMGKKSLEKVEEKFNKNLET